MNIKSFMHPKIILLAGICALNMQLATAREPADLNDLEIAHVAYTADNIDIRYAHLALALSSNPAIHEFANTMIRDHTIVNEQALALLEKLEATPADNFLSQSLQQGAEEIIAELIQLRGDEFDKKYAQNELEYHKAVNELVENQFIPNIENEEVKALFETGLTIFKGHQSHAEQMVSTLQ